jgi:fatty acid-binding protein DegV
MLTLQETLNEMKLKGKEIEICQIDCTISTHSDTDALSVNALTKTKKQIV